MLLPSEEKRKAIRVPVDLETYFKKDNKEYSGRILNISTEGAFVKAVHLFDANDVLDLSFHLPGSGHMVQTKARVIWGGSLEAAAWPSFIMGIHFEHMANSDSKEIVEYIQNLLKA